MQPPPFDQGQQQTWTQVGQLLVATGLSSIIGLEREWKHKSAGLRTNTLVGIGACLFMLISKFGTFDVLDRSLVVLDPTRIAAQIVSGIGFIGGGIIFKQRNEVRGLTTAAGIWLSAAVGAACGAGLLRLATISTGLYFIAVLVYPQVLHCARKRFKNRFDSMGISAVVRYRSGTDGLQALLQTLMEAGFCMQVVTRLEEVVFDQTADQEQSMSNMTATRGGKYDRIFDIYLTLDGPGAANNLMQSLSQLDYVISISIDHGPAIERYPGA